jgi:hypothetical protein
MKLFSIGAVLFVMAQAVSSCSTDQFPTVEQINFRLPSSIANCPYAPTSPGRGASKRQVARYIVKLYNSWEICHGNLGVVRELHAKYKGRVCRTYYDKTFCD